MAGPALDTRVAEVIQRPRFLGAGAVPALGHRRGGLRQVTEPGQPRGSRHQPRHLAQRQRLVVRAQMPQQTRDVTGRQQALCPLKLLSHAHTLTKRPCAQPTICPPDLRGHGFKISAAGSADRHDRTRPETRTVHAGTLPNHAHTFGLASAPGSGPRVATSPCDGGASRWCGSSSRGRDAADNRYQRVYLTPDGRRLRETLPAPAARVNEAAAADLSPDDLATLMSLLNRIRTTLGAARTPPSTSEPQPVRGGS